MSTNPKRSAFLQVAGLPELSFWERLARLQFRRSKTTAQPDAAFRAQWMADEVKIFQPTEEGRGAFGNWIVDDAGLPAYEYTADQYANPYAEYELTDGRKRRDHWHQVGNRRITGLASNDGTVQVYAGDQGGVFLNRFDAHTSPHTQSFWDLLLARIMIGAAKLLSRFLRPNPPFTVAIQSAESVSDNPRGAPPVHVVKRLEAMERALASGESEVQAAAALTENLATSSAAAQVTAQSASMPHLYAGGFGYIDDGTEVWSTAYRYRPSGATERRRVFGMGYAEYTTTYRNLQTVRRVYAPHGDVPALLTDVIITNQGETEVNIRYYEYWDVNPHQLRVQWLRSGAAGIEGDSERCTLNASFSHKPTYQADVARLIYEQKVVDPTPPEFTPPERYAEIDWHPLPIFMADLGGTPDAVYLNRAAFFGAGGAMKPDAIAHRRPDTPVQATSANPTPYCFVMRHDLVIPARESRSLRFAYGVGRDVNLNAYQTGTPFKDTREAWKKELAYFWTGDQPELQREMAWHAYNTLSATVYSHFHKVHLVPQGSAYLYLHGADGVPRDQALFVIPTTYLDAKLAKDMLKLIMQLTDGETGQITYSFVGHGAISNGMNIHSNPSDLDLFFLLALTEYLSATGDWAFLNEPVDFYPPERPTLAPGKTVLDHVRFALHHLFDKERGVGIGENNLLHVRSGDWSDSIVLETAISDGVFGKAYFATKANGESVPITQMALYVLPLLADILAERAPDVTALINDGRLDILRQGVRNQWNERGWYNRAVVRDLLNKPVPIDRLELEAQVWALISGFAKDEGHEMQLIEQVETKLDAASPIGAGLRPGGAVWPAVSQLLTWGYARTGRTELAYRSLARNTFLAHAREYPNIWYGIWSGPDGINGKAEKKPGETWKSDLTPMTDFPVMNANPDAMALLGLLRVCGIEPTADGLRIAPRPPLERFVLDVPLLRIEVEPDKIRGIYRAQTNGQITLHVRPPRTAMTTDIPLTFSVGDEKSFEV